MLQREEIYQAVWGYAMAHGDRSVDVFVRKVRQKLETASPDWSYIHTHFGVGYRFQPERPGGPDEAAAFEASLAEEPRAPAPAPLSRSEEQPLDPELGEAEVARARRSTSHTSRAAMSRNQRIGLVVAALVVAVIAFVVASPGGDDDGDKAAQTTPTTSRPRRETGTTETQAEAPAPPKPEVTRIEIRGGEVVGGPPEIRAKNGDTVEIVVSADAPNDLHLHGYDIEKTAKPGQPARFKFKANAEGEFELESHTAEHAGLEPLVATLIVEPR